MNSNLVLKKRVNSFYYAFKGLRIFFSTQINAHIHLLGLLSMITLGLYFNVSKNEWLVLIFAAGFVFVTEILNTAIEFLTDLVSPQYNEQAGRVKDIAAGAVLVSAMLALIVAGIIFIPRIIP